MRSADFLERPPAQPNSRALTTAATGIWLVLALAAASRAQTFSLDWSTVDGGGGASTGGAYAVRGTIGQPDAGTMSGGQFTLTGGFWSTVAAVQMPGAPCLSVTRSDTVVAVSWPKADPDWKLECTTSLVA